MNAFTVRPKSLAAVMLLPFFASFAAAQLITPKGRRTERPVRTDALLVMATEIEGVSAPDYSPRTRAASFRSAATFAISDLSFVPSVSDANSHSILSPASASAQGPLSSLLSWRAASVLASDSTLAEHDGADVSLSSSSVLLTFR